VAGARLLIEKKLMPPWDVLIHAWFDLSSDLPPAAIHREFFGRDGAFRAGPPLEEFDGLFDDLMKCIDPEEARRGAEAIDRWVFDEVAALPLCAPQALYAVNRHADFKAYRILRAGRHRRLARALVAARRPRQGRAGRRREHVAGGGVRRWSCPFEMRRSPSRLTSPTPMRVPVFAHRLGSWSSGHSARPRRSAASFEAMSARIESIDGFVHRSALHRIA
jgi:hypothetical protein